MQIHELDTYIGNLSSTDYLAIDDGTETTKLPATSLVDVFYPVGSYYETSDTSFDPNTAWGGTWIQETAGQVHISSGTGYEVSGALTNTSDGGSATHHHSTADHTLTIAEMPSHTHVVKAEYYQRGSGNLTTYGYVRQNGTNTGTSEATGGNGAHNHGNTGDTSTMPPYIIVNRWHRTA